MLANSLLNPREWARRTFGAVVLPDLRLRRRAVQFAARFLRCPMGSLPAQMQHPHLLKALYRFCDSPKVTFAALSKPHWTQTRAAAGQAPLVLLIQDTTQIDHTHHPTTTGLAPIGEGHGRGYLLQTMLAVLPQPRQLLGVAFQQPFLRTPAPPRKSKKNGPRPEAEVWSEAVRTLGAPPPGVRWVHVGDRYSDIFDFLATCRAQQSDFLVRAAQNRGVRWPLGADGAPVPSLAPPGGAAGTPGGLPPHLLFPAARTLPTQGTRALELPARPGRPARTAQVQIAWGPLWLQAPTKGPKRPALALWVIRVWEAAPPPETEPLEWILLTSVPTESLAAAWARVEWYQCRWLAEDYHQCLKTGCQIERRQLRDYASLVRLLGFLGPLAARLLSLREEARLQPDRWAWESLPPELVQVVAELAEVSPERLTVGKFWRAVARLGGHQGRKRDGPPGWQTLWKGWLYVQTLLEGIELASRLSYETCG